MAHEARVVRSVNSPCGLHCVDIVAEAGGLFGWVSYRRDPEDLFGWRADGPRASGFDSAAAAMTAARLDIGWMEIAE